MEVSLSRPKVALGSPVEVTYKFTVAPDAPNLGPAPRVRPLPRRRRRADVDRRSRSADADRRSGRPGQTIEYTRTMFVAELSRTSARAKVVAGLYTPGNNERAEALERGSRRSLVQGRRLRAAAADREHLRDLQGRLASRPKSWPKARAAPSGSGPRRKRRMAFRNPKRESMLVLQVDNPVTGPNAAQQVDGPDRRSGAGHRFR